MLRFHLLPTEHRVVVTHDAVRAATGNYYVRAYGKGDDTHARASDGKYPVGARPPTSSVPARAPLRSVLHSASPAPRAPLTHFSLRLDTADEDFFCAVTEKFVTSNLNKSNLEMECVTYA